MRINELEERLSVSRANIRYYEKEGLLAPKRMENGYRDYSQEDVEVLKKIIILRKIGVPLQNVKEVLAGTCTLQKALEKNEQELKVPDGRAKCFHKR